MYRAAEYLVEAGHAYVDEQTTEQMRLNRARAMRRAPVLPVKAIAPAVGLNDEYQLSKLFRRHFNLSPREMRARVGL